MVRKGEVAWLNAEEMKAAAEPSPSAYSAPENGEGRASQSSRCFWLAGCSRLLPLCPKDLTCIAGCLHGALQEHMALGADCFNRHKCCTHWASILRAGGFERHGQQSNHMGSAKAWQMQSEPLEFLPSLQLGSMAGMPRQRGGPSNTQSVAFMSGPRASLGGGFQMMGQVNHSAIARCLLRRRFLCCPRCCVMQIAHKLGMVASWEGVVQDCCMRLSCRMCAAD